MPNTFSLRVYPVDFYCKYRYFRWLSRRDTKLRPSHHFFPFIYRLLAKFPNPHTTLHNVLHNNRSSFSPLV
jgi:hypothetical protein